MPLWLLAALGLGVGYALWRSNGPHVGDVIEITPRAALPGAPAGLMLPPGNVVQLKVTGVDPDHVYGNIVGYHGQGQTTFQPVPPFAATFNRSELTK